MSERNYKEKLMI